MSLGTRLGGGSGLGARVVSGSGLEARSPVFDPGMAGSLGSGQWQEQYRSSPKAARGAYAYSQEKEELVLGAVSSGLTSTGDISDATGLSFGDVRHELKALEEMGVAVLEEEEDPSVSPSRSRGRVRNSRYDKSPSMVRETRINSGGWVASKAKSAYGRNY